MIRVMKQSVEAQRPGGHWTINLKHCWFEFHLNKLNLVLWCCILHHFIKWSTLSLMHTDNFKVTCDCTCYFCANFCIFAQHPSITFVCAAKFISGFISLQCFSASWCLNLLLYPFLLLLSHVTCGTFACSH